MSLRYSWRQQNNLKRENRRMWGIKTWMNKCSEVQLYCLSQGALGNITKNFGQQIEILGIGIRNGLLQKPMLLETARILKRVLDF